MSDTPAGDGAVTTDGPAAHPMTAAAADASPLAEPTVSAPPPLPRRRRGWIAAVVLLAVGLAAAAGAAVWLLLELQEARAGIRDRDDELREQRELIDRKDRFGAAMNQLLDEVDGFAGVPIAALVPWDEYQLLAGQGWARRWNAEALDKSIAAVEDAREALIARRGAAASEASVNATGSVYESTLDRLGAGYVTWRLDDADGLCGSDVLACVTSDKPLVVHVDAPDDALPYMTDWIRTGLAYHEFAHVLQYTNPEPTETALAAFSGDSETMADCYALTFLDGWTLDHRVWASSYEYWDVSIGYGYTCDEAQRQSVRDWVAELGVRPRELGPR